MKSRSIGLLMVMMAVIAVLLGAYRDVGAGDFIWDDKAFLVQKAVIRNAQSTSELFLQPFDISEDYYRPLVVLTYGLQYQAVGLNAPAFHWVNFWIHCLNSVLVGLAVFLLCNTHPTAKWLAFGGALLYSLHPAMIEATSWISGRFDLMVTFFLLLALLIDLVVIRRWAKALLIGIAFLCAACSKETAVGFAFALPVFHLFKAALSENTRRVPVLKVISENWPTYAAIVVAGLSYIWLRIAAMGYITSGLVYNDYGSWLQRLLLSSKALTQYLYMIFVPTFSLSPLHFQLFPVELSDVAAWISMALVAGIAITAAYVLAMGHRLQCCFIGLIGVVAALLPALHLFQTPLQHSLVQERYLQFPLALFVVTAGAVVGNCSLSKRAKTVGTAFVLGFSLYSYATIQTTVPLWRSDLALWSWVTAREPRSQAGWTNLSAAYLELGRLDKAEESARIAYKMDQANAYTAHALINLGAIAAMRGDLEKSAGLYLDAINTTKQVPGALVNMANTLIRMRELESAKWYLDVAHDLAMETYQYQMNVGLYWLLMENPRLAQQHFELGLKLIDSSQRAPVKALVDSYLNGSTPIPGAEPLI